MLCTSMKKMAMYIGTKFGDDAAPEWISGKHTTQQEPAYLPKILARHAERVKATRDQLNLKLTSLREERVDIKGKINADPGNCSLKKGLQEVNDNIAKIEI